MLPGAWIVYNFNKEKSKIKKETSVLHFVCVCVVVELRFNEVENFDWEYGWRICALIKMYKKTTIVTVKVFPSLSLSERRCRANKIHTLTHIYSKYIFSTWQISIVRCGAFYVTFFAISSSRYDDHQTHHKHTHIFAYCIYKLFLFFFFVKFLHANQAYHKFCCMSFSRCKTCNRLRNIKLVGWIHSVYIIIFFCANFLNHLDVRSIERNSFA